MDFNTKPAGSRNENHEGAEGPAGKALTFYTSASLIKPVL
jgi:hypothetical protein